MRKGLTLAAGELMPPQISNAVTAHQRLIEVRARLAAAFREQNPTAAVAALFADQTSVAPIVLLAAARAYELAPYRPNVSTVARAIGFSVRQLEREFTRLDLAPPVRLVIPTRWLAVSHVVSAHQPRAAAIASVLQFSTTQSYCRALRREVGLTTALMRTGFANARLTDDICRLYAGSAARCVGRW